MVAFFAEPRWWSALGFILSCLVALELVGLSSDLISLIDAKHALKILTDPEKKNQRLEPVDIEELKTWLPEEIQFAVFNNDYSTLSKPFFRRSFGLTGKFRKTCIYVRTFIAPPFDYLLKAFISFSGSSFVFLRDNVSSEVNVYDKFKLFHELAHVSKYGIATLAYRYERMLSAIVGIAVILVLAPPLGYFVIGLIIFVLEETVIWLVHPVRFEEKADCFALIPFSKAEVQEINRLFQIQGSLSTGINRGFEIQKRVANMAAYYESRFVKESPFQPDISWNDPMTVVDILALMFFGYCGFQAGNSVYNLSMILMAGIVFLCLVLFIHARLTLRVATKQVELEYWINHYTNSNVKSF